MLTLRTLLRSYPRHLGLEMTMDLIGALERSGRSAPSQDMNPLMSVNDIAQLLNLGRTAVYQLVREAHFPKPYAINARCLRWERLEIDAWLLSRKESSSPVRNQYRSSKGKVVVNGVTFIGGKR